MKRLSATLFASLLCVSLWAVPALPGLRKTIVLADGTKVSVSLRGDEHAHYWLSDDGQTYAETGDNVFRPIAREQLQQQSLQRRKATARRQTGQSRRVAFGERTNYKGTKRGIVILMQFKDVAFQEGHTQAAFDRLLNEQGFDAEPHQGSAADYFREQSNGQFELAFDVAGPYTASRDLAYYGENDSQGNDKHAEDLIREACEAADRETDFADYDWDGDGKVDQVFVVYAGRGEADGGGASTIWPHMFYLSGMGRSITLDGTEIDAYACSNEINSQKALAGIGIFCHEFSHCLGLPDFYDTTYSGWAGMGELDIMDTGCYNGGSHRPAGYTAHEKMMCGWTKPVVLGTEDVQIDCLLPQNRDGDSYIIYNDAHPDEYFMIENRQREGFDSAYPGRGLLVTHVDFDETIWAYNLPNSKVTTTSEYYQSYHYPLNDHQRMTPVPADNRSDSRTVGTDLFPYQGLDSLTGRSTPALSYYNQNLKGTTQVEWSISQIRQHGDGSMSFLYKVPKQTPTDVGQTAGEGVTGPTRFYRLDGRRAGNSHQRPERGFYLTERLGQPGRTIIIIK